MSHTGIRVMISRPSMMGSRSASAGRHGHTQHVGRRAQSLGHTGDLGRAEALGRRGSRANTQSIDRHKRGVYRPLQSPLEKLDYIRKALTSMAKRMSFGRWSVYEPVPTHVLDQKFESVVSIASGLIEDVSKNMQAKDVDVLNELYPLFCRYAVSELSFAPALKSALVSGVSKALDEMSVPVEPTHKGLEGPRGPADHKHTGSIARDGKLKETKNSSNLSKPQSITLTEYTVQLRRVSQAIIALRWLSSNVVPTFCSVLDRHVQAEHMDVSLLSLGTLISLSNALGRVVSLCVPPWENSRFLRVSNLDHIMDRTTGPIGANDIFAIKIAPWERLTNSLRLSRATDSALLSKRVLATMTYLGDVHYMERHSRLLARIGVAMTFRYPDAIRTRIDLQERTLAMFYYILLGHKSPLLPQHVTKRVQFGIDGIVTAIETLSFSSDTEELRELISLTLLISVATRQPELYIKSLLASWKRCSFVVAPTDTIAGLSMRVALSLIERDEKHSESLSYEARVLLRQGSSSLAQSHNVCLSHVAKAFPDLMSRDKQIVVAPVCSSTGIGCDAIDLKRNIVYMSLPFSNTASSTMFSFLLARVMQQPGTALASVLASYNSSTK